MSSPDQVPVSLDSNEKQVRDYTDRFNICINFCKIDIGSGHLAAISPQPLFQIDCILLVFLLVGFSRR